MVSITEPKTNLTSLVRSFLFISLSVFIAFIFFAVWLNSGNSTTFRANIKHLLKNELISLDSISSATNVDAIYIMGGSQSSLEFKFKAAAELYHKGISKKIMILSRPGITEYSSLLGRNLTNDEWAIWKLEELGIPKNSVEPISMPKGVFGTLTEAKGISRLIKKKGYKSVILISSPHHTHRVRISFRNFLKDYNVSLYVKGSDKRGSLTELIIEFTKLKIYKYFLV